MVFIYKCFQSVFQTRSLTGVGKQPTSISFAEGMSANIVEIELSRSAGSTLPIMVDGLLARGCVKVPGDSNEPVREKNNNLGFRPDLT